MKRTNFVRRACGVIAGSLVAATSLVALTATPASAAWDSCAASGYLCVYNNANGSSGGVKVYGGNDTQYSDNNFSSCSLSCNVNDAVSSQWNRETYNVRSYQADNYGSSAMDTPPNSAHYSMPAGYNDTLSSHQQF